jgi:hypothetical protein
LPETGIVGAAGKSNAGVMDRLHRTSPENRATCPVAPVEQEPGAQKAGNTRERSPVPRLGGEHSPKPREGREARRRIKP